MRLIGIILAAVVFLPLLLFGVIFVSIVWTHRPIPLREIIKGLLFGSGKEK